MREKYELTKHEWDYVNGYLQSKGLPIDRSVTFDDIPMPDRYSEVRSRSDITDFSAELYPGIELGIPIILANMVSVAGIKAIVAMEREGGLGIPPQMLPIRARLEIIERVGRTECAHIGKPLTIGPEKTLAQAKQLMNRFGIYSLVVIDDNRRPIGILSTRDWRYETDDEKPVRDLMGGRRGVHKALKNISFEAAGKILRKHRIEKLPLVDKRGQLAGLLTAHGLFYRHHHPRALSDGKGRFLKAGSIGVGRRFTNEQLREVELQVRKGITLLLIDTARAFSVNTREAIHAVKERFPKLPLMVGNTSTPEGAKALFEWGADIVKVGIGPGAPCTTRYTGIGVPQLSAVAKCAAIAKFGAADGKIRKIVADGGVKNPGDIVKAVIAGADAVMCGGLFIGTVESAAPSYINKDGLRVKNYIGSASFQAQQERMGSGTLDRIRRPEGMAKEVPVIGNMQEVVAEVLDGMRSAMSYLGVKSVKDLRLKGRFDLPQTSAGLYEGIKRK